MSQTKRDSNYHPNLLAVDTNGVAKPLLVDPTTDRLLIEVHVTAAPTPTVNRILRDQNHISTSFAAGSAFDTTDMESYHPLTEDSLLTATTFADLSGNSRTGTSNNTPTFGTGPFGDANGAMVFNGTNDAVNLGSHFLDIEDISISCWINPVSYGEAALGYLLRVTNQRFWQMRSTGARTRMSSNAATTFAQSGVSSVNPGSDTWYQVICTSTSAGVTNFYFDGVLSGTANQSSGTPVTGTGNMIIGNDSTPSGARSFEGKIAHMRTFSRILTTDEITVLANETVSGLGEAIDTLPLHIDSRNGYLAVDIFVE